MNNKWSKFLVYFILLCTCAIFFTGVVYDNKIILVSFAFIAGIVSAALVGVLIDLLFSKPKKKMKDKRIRIKVVFVRKHDASETTFAQIFFATDLTQCVFDALHYTKLSHCKIKSMELLTTED